MSSQCRSTILWWRVANIIELNIIKLLCLTEIYNLSVNYDTTGWIQSKQLFRSLTVKWNNQQIMQPHRSTTSIWWLIKHKLIREKQRKFGSSDATICKIHGSYPVRILTKTQNVQTFCGLLWSLTAHKGTASRVRLLAPPCQSTLTKITPAFNAVLNYWVIKYSNVTVKLYPGYFQTTPRRHKWKWRLTPHTLLGMDMRGSASRFGRINSQQKPQ